MYAIKPRELWERAKIEQDARLEHDPWMDILERIEASKFRADDGGEEYRIATDAIFAEWLKIPESKRRTGDAVRLTGVMRRLGWNGPDRMYFDARRLRGYRRPA